MNRRNFLKSGSAALAACLSNGDLLGAAPADADAQLGRLILPMNRHWRYSPQRVDGATARNFDDSRFELVTIPHSNVKLPWHSFDEKSYQFVSVYRRHFKLPRVAKSRRVFVDFDGAMTAAAVWLNGNRLGEYKGGYTPFSFELTPSID